jgi:hypothetical protein
LTFRAVEGKTTSKVEGLSFLDRTGDYNSAGAERKKRAQVSKLHCKLGIENERGA